MVKKILLVSFVSITSISAHAEGYMELCASVSELAKTTMQGRQGGAPMNKLMEIAKGNKLIEELIILAYDSPRYGTESMRAKSIENFRDKAYLECIKEFRKNK